MEVEAPCAGNAGEGRWSKLASSLAVRNVQALAASAADELTADAIERYIQPDIDAHAVLAERSDDVPVIDLGKLLNAKTVEAEAEKLRFACEEWGFFQVSVSRIYITDDGCDDRSIFHDLDFVELLCFAGCESWSAG